MAPARILIVDDDLPLLAALAELLSARGYAVATAGSAEEAFEKCRAETFHVVLCDLQLPGKNGISLIKTLHGACPSTATVLITGHGTIRSAVTALKRGAVEYITKPVKPKRILALVAQLTADPPAYLPNHLLAGDSRVAEFDGLRARSQPMHEVFDRARLAASSDAPVLLIGESGTGKERLARAIHDRSRRAAGPFVVAATSASGSQLVAAELFGCERGAVPGANERRPGKVELAHGGTLFIDEIAALDEPTQVKLLRLLEAAQWTRLGGRREQSVDLRIIAASTRAPGSTLPLREDLLYRLRVFAIDLPALRERADDVPLLADQLLRELARKYGKEAASLPSETQRLLAAYRWPGNLRELHNVMEHAVLLSRGRTLEPQLLPQTLHRDPPRSGTLNIPLGVPMGNIEKEVILRTLEAHQGNKTAAAQALGISRRSIYNKLAGYGV